MAVVTASEKRDLLEAGLLPPESPAARATGEREREEELVVYHSLANDRTNHMVTEGEPLQVSVIIFDHTHH